MKIYIDGHFHEKQDACISVFDHGLLYGDGVFEGIRIYGGEIFKLEAHVRRLYQSARAILLDIPLSEEAMRDAIAETVRVNDKKDGYIRALVTRGAGALGIDPASCATPSVIIIVDDIQLYPQSYYQEGIAIMTASTRRMPSDSLDPRVKSLNYLNNIMAKLEARQAGCLEAVMLNHEGFVAECTGDNIFVVKNGGLSIPDPCYGALDGITMGTILELAEEMKIPCRQSALTRYDLYTADECFLTGTGAEIIPVVRIDGRSIGGGTPGRITRQLKNAFEKTVRHPVHLAA